MSVIKDLLIGVGVVVLAAFVAPDCRGAGVPDVITLGSLAKLYDKVKFNHAGHIAILKDCAECHHHTTGTILEDGNCVRCHRNSNETRTVACKGCHATHPFTAQSLSEKDLKTYHLDKPGLKGAYHQSCLGCHSRMGAPTGCQDCHARTEAGDAFFNAGAFAPKGETAGHGGH